MTHKICSDDKDMSTYLIQTQYLEQLLERLQLQCDELQTQSQDLASGCSALKTDATDTCEYLKDTAVEKEKKMEQLTERLEKQQLADQQQEEEALRLQLSQKLMELQDWIHQQQDNINLAAKAEEQLMSDSIRRFKETWSREARAIETKMRDLVQEERAQHGELREDVQFLLDQNDLLWRQKDKLQDQKDLLLQEVDDLRNDVEKLRQKNSTRNEGLELLTKRSQLKDCRTAHESLLVEEEALRRLLTSASKERRQNTSEAGHLRAELQREQSGRTQQEAGMWEAAIVLIRILKENSEKRLKTQRKMLRLLEALQSSGPQGPGSTPEESSDPLMDSTQTLNLATEPLLLMARYKPGDLGLGPRPMWKHKPAVCRTGAQPPPDRSVRKKLLRQKRSSSDPEAFTSADC